MIRTNALPKISVIIPTHNRADYIGETIQSIINQTYSDWELIILDDGSTDDTPRIVGQFDDERLIYIRREDNIGGCAARNEGFAASRGELVSFLDSDDLMLPHNLETLASLLDARPEVDIAYGWYYWMGINGETLMWDFPKIEGYIPPQIDIPWPEVDLQPVGPTLEGQILSRLVLEETFMIGSTLIRRECVEKIGGFNESVEFQEHWDFYLRLAQAGCVYACSRQGVALWRQHPGNRGLNKDDMLSYRVAILDRLFNDPALEASLADVRNQAYYNAYIDAFRNFYIHGNFEKGAMSLREALPYALQLSDGVVKLAFDLMSVHNDLTSKDKNPVQFACELFEPVQQTSEFRRLRRQVLGQLNANLAFHHYQTGELGQVWRYALGAVSHDPSWLRNRGLARIALEGLAGQGITDWIHSRLDPPSPKLLEAVAETTSIFISPHLDDVVLSCGGILAHLAQRNAKMILVTVFTADPPDEMSISSFAQELQQSWGEDPYKVRREEDKTTADYLNAECRWLDFLDVIYRDHSIQSGEELFLTEFDARSDPCFESVRDAILQLVNEHPGAIVFAPLGLGYHRDHLLVHQALEDIKTMTSVVSEYYYYEDYPYAAKAEPKTRLAELKWKAKPLTIDITNTLEERARLITMHASQVDMLFGNPNNVYQTVKAYATRVGTRNKPRERFWTVRGNGQSNGAGPA